MTALWYAIITLLVLAGVGLLLIRRMDASRRRFLMAQLAQVRHLLPRYFA
jgi:hypothetical protein